MITYNAGRFEVLPDDYWSKDPMERGPLVIRDWKPMYLSSVKWADPYLEAEKWKGIQVVPTAYQHRYSNARDVINDLMLHYNDSKVIGKYIGQVQAQIDDIIEVKLF